MAVLLTGDVHSAGDLVQSCPLKLYRVGPGPDTGPDADAHRSWWRVNRRREVPIASVPDVAEAQGDQAPAMAVRAALTRLPVNRRGRPGRRETG